MARALSDDLRVRVVKASSDGLSARQAAARFGVGISTAIRWIARARTGELTARPQGRRRGSSLDAHEAFIVALIEERRDITLHEMATQLLAEQAAGRFSIGTHAPRVFRFQRQARARAVSLLALVGGQCSNAGRICLLPLLTCKK